MLKRNFFLFCFVYYQIFCTTFLSFALLKRHSHYFRWLYVYLKMPNASICRRIATILFLFFFLHLLFHSVLSWASNRIFCLIFIYNGIHGHVCNCARHNNMNVYEWRIESFSIPCHPSLFCLSVIEEERIQKMKWLYLSRSVTFKLNIRLFRFVYLIYKYIYSLVYTICFCHREFSHHSNRKWFFMRMMTTWMWWTTKIMHMKKKIKKDRNRKSWLRCHRDYSMWFQMRTFLSLRVTFLIFK